MQVHASDESRRVIRVEWFSEDFLGINGDGVGDVKDRATIEVGSDLRIEIFRGHTEGLFDGRGNWGGA